MASALKEFRPRLRAPLLLGAAAFLLFTIALGQTALWDVDEAKYAAVARESMRRADPLTLYWNDVPWFDKPPLYMWLVGLTGRLAGFSEWTVRLWVAAFGAAGVAVTFLIGRRLYDVRTGVLAGLVLMTTLEYFVLARLAVLDVPLVVFLLLALYMVVVAMDADGAARRRAYRWAFVWAGLGTLTKGPIALLLPGMVITVWWLLRGELRRFRELPWEGVFLYAVIGFSWYAVEAALHGLPFLRMMVGYHMVQRFFGVVDNQPGPWYFYIPVLVGGGIPWSAFLPSAVVFSWRRVRHDRAAPLLLLWMGLIFLFYSAAGTKLPNYLLPVFPVAAVAVARLWVGVLEEDPAARALARWGMVALPLVLLLVAAGLALAGRSQYPAEIADLRRELQALTLLAVVGPVAGLGLLLARRSGPALAAVVLGAVIALGALVLLVQPRLEAYRPMKPLALLLRSQVSPGDPVVIAGAAYTRPSVVYYADTRAILAKDPDALRRDLCRTRRSFVVAPRGTYERWIRATAGDALAPVAERGGMIVLRQVGPIPCASP